MVMNAVYSLFLLPVRLYQLCISPLLGTRCRFEPSCSHYAQQAVAMHGARGLLLAAWRLLRCQPFARSGHDPVPTLFSFSTPKD